MSKIVPLYILGSSGHAQEVAVYAKELNPDRLIFFVDKTMQGVDYLNIDEYLLRLSQDGGESIMGSGRCEVRKRMLQEIQPPFAIVIHPRAVVLGRVGPGSVVAPGAVIAPNARIQNHVMVNYNATVGHDTIVDDLSVIGPGAAIGGRCRLREAVYIGSGALVRENIQIEHDAVVGMGAVVTKDVSANIVAVGIPARFKDKSNSVGRWLK